MDKETLSQHIFVILGAARSGTSTIARALKALGIDLGNHLTRPSKSMNPKGFWEDNDIVYKINRKVFEQIESLSSGITLLDKQVLLGEQLQSLKQSAISLLKQRFRTTDCWGFKDPQTARLVPFWQSVFSSLNLDEHYIIALRNPLSCAQSYRNASGADIETGLLLWLMHIVPAIQDTIGEKRVIVSYEHLMANPRLQLERLQNNLGRVNLAQAEEIDQYVDEFLDKKLYRNQFTYENFKYHRATQLFPICLQTYDLLLRVAQDQLNFHDTKFIKEWEVIWHHVTKEQPLYRYMDSLLKKCHQTHIELRSIQRSRLWKIIYPLRVIQAGINAFNRVKKKTILNPSGDFPFPFL